MKRRFEQAYEYSSACWRTGSGTMDHGYTPAPRLYRDIQGRWLAGVLAGAAQHFGWSLTALRLVVIIASLTPLVPIVVIAYVLGALLIPPRRSSLPPPPPGASEWQAQAPASRHSSPEELRVRIRELEERLRSMEAYVTSPEYEIDRELKRRSE